MEWERSKTALQEAKESEMELRKKCVEFLFPNPSEGTQRVELGMGYNAKLVHKINYTLADNDKVEAALERLSKVGNEGKFIADRVVKWTPTLSLTEYRELEPKYKAIIDEVITTSSGAPTLSIEEPKQKKGK